MRKLILLLTAIFLIACQEIREQKPTDKASKILGTWVSNEGVYYSFSSDKTGEVGDHVEGEKILWWDIIEDSIFMVIELHVLDMNLVDFLSVIIDLEVSSKEELLC